MINYILIALFFLFSFNSSAEELRKVTLQLKWYHQFQFAGYYAAKIKGFYKEKGIDVEIFEGNIGTNIIDQIVNDKADFGVQDNELLYAFLEKKPVVLISSIYQHSPYVLISKKELNLKSPKDFKGKRVVFETKESFLNYKTLFSSNGLTDIKFEFRDWQINDILENKADAFAGYISNEVYDLKKLNVDINVLPADINGLDFYGDALFTSRRFAEDNAELVEDFKDATLNGWQYAFSHKDEIINYILSLHEVKERGVTFDKLMYEAKSLEGYVISPLVSVGHNNFDRWEKIANNYKKLGFFDGPIHINSFIFEYDKTNSNNLVKSITYIIAAATIIFLFSLLWIYQLKKRVTKKTLEIQKEIEQRTETERLLMEERNFFRNIMENVPDAIYFKDLDSKFIRINKSTAAGFQLENPDDAIGKSDFDFFSKEHASIAYNDEKNVISTGVPIINKEEKEPRSSGIETWASTTKMPFYDSEGKLIGTFGISRDITTRKFQEQLLASSEMKFKTLFETNNDAIFIFDENGILDCNKKTFELFGLDEADRTWFNIYDFSPPYQPEGISSIEKINKKIAEALEGEAQEFEWVYIRKEGTTFIADVTLSRVNLDNKYVLQSIVRDITERKAAEEIVKKYGEVFQNTKMGIAICDPEVNFIQSVNPSFSEMLGYNQNNLVNKAIFDLLPDESIVKFQECYNNVLLYGHYATELEIKAFNDELIPVQVDISLVNDNRGNSIFSIINVQNISSRYESQIVQEVLYKISEAVNTTHDMMDLYKAIHENIKLLMKADNFFIALTDKEHTIISFAYFVDTYDQQPPDMFLEKTLTSYVIRTGKDLLVDEEMDMELRDKEEIQVIGEPSKIWLGVPLKINDKVIGVIVVQDYENPNTYGEKEKQILLFVSEQIALAIDRKRKEEELKIYAQELKELNANKDKFFSIIAHDLRSPFFALLAISELLNNEFDNLSREEIENITRELDKALKNQYKLLENLLEWARLQTGRTKYQPANYNVFEEVNYIYDLLRANMIKKNITFNNNTNDQHFFFADINMIHSVIQNLVSNAVKFTPKDGYITVHSYEDDSGVQIQVTDSGVGIGAKDLDKIFQIDQQHTTLGTEKEKGTGLGLILCKELVEKNKGSIYVESIEGKGATFTIKLPKAEVLYHSSLA